MIFFRPDPVFIFEQQGLFMKKIATGCFILIVIFFAGWFFLQPRQLLETSFQPSDLLPETTLMTLEMMNVEGNLQSFRNSRLGKNLAAMDYPLLLEQLGVSRHDIIAFENARKTLLSNLKNPLFNELFGKETALALLSFDQPLPVFPVPEYFLNRMLIISRPRHNTNLLSSVAQWLGKDLDIRKEVYRQHHITRIELDNKMPLYCTSLNDLFIASTDMQTLCRSLDVSEGLEIALSDNNAYQNLSRQLRSSENAVFSYVNPAELRKKLLLSSRSVSHLSDRAMDWQKDLSSNLKGIYAIGSIFDIHNSQCHTSRVVCLVDKENMAPVFRQTFSIDPAQNQTLSMIPSHPLLYYWSNTFHLETYLQHSLHHPKQRQQLENNFQEQLGITPEQLMKALGKQCAVVLKDIRIDGFIPIPKLVLLMEVTDQKTVSRFLRATFQKSGLRYRQESFMGKIIHSAQLPMGIALEPAYTFFNGFCILGSHPEMIKQVLSKQQEKDEFTATDIFKDVNQGLTDANNHISFIRNDILIEKIQGLVEWGNHILVMKGDTSSRKYRIMTEQLFHPIIDGFRIYDTIGIRTRFGENTLENLTIYHINGQPAS
jgi:hypothetical protein